MRSRWQYILLSLVMAIFTWHLVAGREMVETWVPVSIQMTNPPKGLIVREGMQTGIEVRIRASKGLIRSLDDRKLFYSVDARNFRVGENVITFEPKKLQLSSAFEVAEIKPPRMNLLVDKVETRRVPVRAEFIGATPDSLVLESIRVQPDEVTLRGPATMLREITEAVVNVTEEPGEETMAVNVTQPIVLPAEVEVSPAEVSVDVLFGLKQREIWIKVPLQIKAPEGLAVKTKQDYVRLLIEGPVSLFLNNEFRKEVRADLVIGAQTAPGEYDELGYDVSLPENCRLLRRNPETLWASVRRK